MRAGAPSASPTATTSATSRWSCRPGRRSPASTSSPPASASASCRAPSRRPTSSTRWSCEPVKFPDYNTVYASLKTRQIDAWVAPSQQAQGTVQPGDPGSDHRKHLQLGQFRGLGGRQGEPAADRRAELRAGRGHRRRHLGAAVLRLGAARLPPGWKPGSKAAPAPQLPDFAAIAAEHQPATATASRHRSRRCRNSRTRSSTGTCTSRPSPTCSRPGCRTR